MRFTEPRTFARLSPAPKSTPPLTGSRTMRWTRGCSAIARARSIPKVGVPPGALRMVGVTDQRSPIEVIERQTSPIAFAYPGRRAVEGLDAQDDRRVLADLADRSQAHLVGKARHRLAARLPLRSIIEERKRGSMVKITSANRIETVEAQIVTRAKPALTSSRARRSDPWPRWLRCAGCGPSGSRSSTRETRSASSERARCR